MRLVVPASMTRQLRSQAFSITLMDSSLIVIVVNISMYVIRHHRAIIRIFVKQTMHAYILTLTNNKELREISITDLNCHQPNQTRRDTFITSAIIVNYSHSKSGISEAAQCSEKKKISVGESNQAYS